MQVVDYAGLRDRGITFSKAHLWRLVKAGKFPKPFKIGDARNVWLSQWIDAYIEERVAKRDGEAA